MRTSFGVPRFGVQASLNLEASQINRHIVDCYKPSKRTVGHGLDLISSHSSALYQ